ncbi:LysR family transcriptional regulator [Rhizobium sp. CECT 9324]|uniref:LysR family transcriptional regulator n=1 Tax=Rhizobium sp. CECT 9324 TaxID=2845820 RepID=UPI001E35088B|nr:LysR family transcriptional regulator [Rhizobium sp. CECT 9324]CAH0342339.1 hypothetical protein RHI9324_04062 [Rhizobium sp. CECT 9324]
MDTSTLLITHKVLTGRSIRGTARLMEKPVPSIAAAVERMEAEISVPLIRKAGNGIVLTLEAERLSPAIGLLAEQVERIVAVGNQRSQDVSLSLAALHRFTQVAEIGSIRRAAMHLGIGQPQLARQVIHIETTLGCKLLNRTVNGSTVTPAGRRLAEVVRELETSWHELAHAAAGRSRREAATIRLGSIIPMGHDSFVATLLASLIAAWIDDQPLHPLFIASNTTEELITGLKSGKFNSVLLNSVRISAEFESHLIARSPLSLIGRSDIVGSARGIDGIVRVLCENTVAFPSPKSGLRQVINGLMEAVINEDARDALNITDVDSMPVILNLVLRHGIVSIMPSESVANLPSGLSQIPLPPEYNLPHWLVHAKNDASRQTARAVLTVLEKLGYGEKNARSEV